MSMSDKVFRYCERGGDPAFWAEPLNAITNGAFLIAAVAAAVELSRRRGDGWRIGPWLLTLLVFVIGVGSFLFHTYATRWAAIADVAPIGIFMLGYMGYALAVLLRLHWSLVVIGVLGFVAALYGAGEIQCQRTGLLSITAAARGPCLNGSPGYLPALGAMILIGAALLAMRHKAGPYVLAAGGVFLVSLTLRTVDWEICELTRFAGRTLGTHFLWHVFNATTLYLLLLAAIRHGVSRPRVDGASTGRLAGGRAT